MQADHLQVFENSLLRCIARADFLDRFYDRFLASSPEVASKFEGTDFERQKAIVQESLFQILRAAEEGTPEALERHLGAIAKRHSRHGLDIGSALYDDWLDSLLETVRECDPDFSALEEQVWEEVLAVGIRYLCSRYQSG